MSPTIQNELLDLAANKIMILIIQIALHSLQMSQMMLASSDRMAISVRLVHRKPDDGNRMKHSVREEFLSFVHTVTGTKADHMTTKFLESID